MVSALLVRLGREGGDYYGQGAHSHFHSRSSVGEYLGRSHSVMTV